MTIAQGRLSSESPHAQTQLWRLCGVCSNSTALVIRARPFSGDSPGAGAEPTPGAGCDVGQTPGAALSARRWEAYARFRGESDYVSSFKGLVPSRWMRHQNGLSSSP